MNAEPPTPWLELDDNTEFLCGNRAGFEMLAGAIDAILTGKESTIRLEGNNLCLPGLQLHESRPQPPPTGTTSIRIGLYIFLILLVCILGLAGFGLIQLTNLFLN